MFQTIGEKIEIAGVYKNAAFFPKKMKWRQRILVIEKITLITEIRDGHIKKRMYSFVNKTNLYRVVFNRETEIWILEEIWFEG